MTTRNHQVLKQRFRLFSSKPKMEGLSAQAGEEFDESDVWCCLPGSKPDKKSSTTLPRSRSSTWKKTEGVNNACGSVPVNIPDWSKILLHEYQSRSYDDDVEGEDGDVEEDGVRLPPHEVVMRRRGASLSVVEGVGRTLKGRDLSRVRNAIWAQTGFQD